MPRKANPAGGRRGTRCIREKVGRPNLHCVSVKKQARRNRPPTRYEKLYSKLNPSDRCRVNEAMIAAVNKCTDLDGGGPAGTKQFLETRGEQLIISMQRVGWKWASKRFRDAVSGWAKRHPVTGSGTHGAYPVNSSEIRQQKQSQKMLISEVEDSGNRAAGGA